MDQFSQAKFSYQVEWQGATLGFSEVTGLAVPTDGSEYREGGLNPVLKKIKRIIHKIPGLTKPTTVTLKRGVFRGSPAAFAIWRQAISRQTRHKANIRILVRNEYQQVLNVWRLAKARPVKIVAPDLKVDGNEVAIESVELTCEGVKLE